MEGKVLEQVGDILHFSVALCFRAAQAFSCKHRLLVDKSSL